MARGGSAYSPDRLTERIARGRRELEQIRLFVSMRQGWSYRLEISMYQMR